VGLFFVVRWVGEVYLTHGEEVKAFANQVSGEGFRPLPHFLAALIAVIVLARLLALVLDRFGQPRVIAEVAAGIVLGPSLLGMVWPSAMEFLFPSAVLPILAMVAQLGIVLYMFLIGLHMNTSILRSRAQATVLISHVSIVFPFLLGAVLALLLYRDFAPSGSTFTSFSLFLGLSLAVTAFPVLARILTDRGIAETELGVIALSCAAADDVTAWCLLAIVVGVTQGTVSNAVATIVVSLVFIALMLGVARPVTKKLFGSDEWMRNSPHAMTWIVVAILASALITDKIGIHAIFGAFILGAIIPHDSPLAGEFRNKLEDLVTILLMPAFFACTGVRTQIGLLTHWTDWLICGLIILAATVGKFGGTVLAARFSGLNWRTSASLGALMNTRGLMELIVLNIGLDLGVISLRLFTMMVLMALVTTFATTPAVNALAARSGLKAAT
jgi:Kef-type K+ transport system membrane component KefB